MSHGITILVVEDNAPLREMICRRLILRNYKIVSAVDGESGLSLANEILPDIILLDMSLPGKDGWTIASEMKADQRTEHIPIIAITAHAMQGDREKALQAGCNAFISKPINFTELIQTITANVTETH